LTEVAKIKEGLRYDVGTWEVTVLKDKTTTLLLNSTLNSALFAFKAGEIAP